MNSRFFRCVLAVMVSWSGGSWGDEPAGVGGETTRIVAYDEDGEAVNIADGTASLLPVFKEQVREHTIWTEYVTGLARVLNSEGVERPAWIGNRIRALAQESRRLDLKADHLSLDPNGPTTQALKRSRSKLAAPSAGDLAAAAGTGSISGRIAAVDTGAPLADILVIVWQWPDPLKRTRTGSDGTYSVTGLADGRYYVEAVDTKEVYAAEFYDDFPWKAWNTSTLVGVSSGSPATGIDFDLDLASQITGTVLDEGTGEPVAGAYVHLYMPSDGDTQAFGIGLSTDEHGRFNSADMAGSLNAIEHRMAVYAEGYVDMGYDEVYVDFGMGYSRLTPINLKPGETRDFTISLLRDTQTAYLKGVVRARATGEPLAGIPVRVWHLPDMTTVSSATTDSTGAYRAGPLWSGVYGLGATPKLERGGYAHQTFKGRGWGATPTRLVVLAGSERMGLDFHLDRWGSLKGRVWDSATKSPLEGINTAIIYTPAGRGSTTHLVMETDQDGVYEWPYLNPQNDYRVFTRTGHEYGYVDELYHNIPCDVGECDLWNEDWDWTIGTKIPVGSGQTVGGINIALKKR